jgi:hypothetical protein
VLQESRELEIRGRILAAIANGKPAAKLEAALKTQQQGVVVTPAPGDVRHDAPRDGFVRCDITEYELHVLNEMRNDEAEEEIDLLKQKIAHVAQCHFDDAKSDVFIKNMQEMHAELAELKKVELVKVINVVPSI